MLAVGACDRDGRVVPTSGSSISPGGRCLGPDLLAPGAEVPVAGRNDTIDRMSGTSIACGLVAGVVALLRQAEPTASADDLVSAMTSTAAALEPDQSDRSLGGMVSAAAALERLTGRGAAVRGERSRPSPVAEPWVDPFLLKLISRSDAAAPLTAVVVAPAGPDAIDSWDAAVESLPSELRN